ncbi:MAG: ArdC family protein [Zoogloeaceae bacterium]|jgi:hypothetical protein|nr:ArdC family protein [Zoogloeaceae bacterium]
MNTLEFEDCHSQQTSNPHAGLCPTPQTLAEKQGGARQGQALGKGRSVKKGEHGVKVVTFVPCEKTDKETGEVSKFTKSHITTVFHISQTQEI